MELAMNGFQDLSYNETMAVDGGTSAWTAVAVGAVAIACAPAAAIGAVALALFLLAKV
jgi:hypothetical protein